MENRNRRTKIKIILLYAKIYYIHYMYIPANPRLWSWRYVLRAKWLSKTLKLMLLITSQTVLISCGWEGVVKVNIGVSVFTNNGIIGTSKFSFYKSQSWLSIPLPSL